MSAQLKDKDLKAFLHGFSSLSQIRSDGPQVMVKGEGVYVFDDQGHRYLEANSGLWNAVLGFNDEVVLDAARAQFDQISAYHTFFGRNSEPGIELAGLLASVAPMPAGRVFFTNSGSEANDTAVKMAWMVQRNRGQAGRRKIISRRGAYHGTTVMGANLTGRDYNRVFGMPFGDVRFTDCPHYWRYGGAGETESAFLDRLVANLEQLIELEGPETIAAFIAEPLLGAGGVILPPAGYFPRIRQVLGRYGILLIADEVITGLGRTGNLWGTQTFDIEPDIITTSKCVTAGYYPVGAVLPSAEITVELDAASEAMDEFPHGFTTAGNPVGCAIGVATVNRIVNDGVFDHLVKVAPYFQQRLRAFADHEHVGEVRGIGLTGAIEVVQNKESKVAFDSTLGVSDRIAQRGLSEGIVIRPIGGAVIFAPPFIVTPDEIDELFDAFVRTLNGVTDDLHRLRSVK
jgi:adenosylmethionine-8-amino-7-oxononanoate aminotransferase